MSKSKKKPAKKKQGRTDDLIDNLCEGLEPCCALGHPLSRSMKYIGFSLLYVAAIIYTLGFRPDVAEMLMDRIFLFEIGLSSLIFVSAAFSAAWLCVPDMRGQGWVLSVPMTLLGIFLFWMGLEALTEVPSPVPHDALHNMPHCTLDCLLISGIPAAAIVFISMKGATTRPILSSFMGMICMSALGYTVLKFTCLNDDLTHVALYHLLPFIIGGGILGFIAQRFYRW